jgi:hypothetical protein
MDPTQNYAAINAGSQRFMRDDKFRNDLISIDYTGTASPSMAYCPYTGNLPIRGPRARSIGGSAMATFF